MLPLHCFLNSSIKLCCYFLIYKLLYYIYYTNQGKDVNSHTSHSSCSSRMRGGRSRSHGAIGLPGQVQTCLADRKEREATSEFILPQAARSSYGPKHRCGGRKCQGSKEKTPTTFGPMIHPALSTLDWMLTAIKCDPDSVCDIIN